MAGMSHSPTSVLVRTGSSAGVDPTSDPGPRPASNARGDADATRRRFGSSLLTSERSSFDGRTASRSETRGPRRSRLVVRVGAKELAIAGVVYLAYWFGRTLTRDSHGAASRNAERVIDVERTLGSFTEMRLQRWAIDVPGVVEFLNRYYVWVHFPATIAFLVWVFAVRRHSYATIRCWFAAVTVAGLVIHVLFPLAPPRMTPGFIDTLDAFGPDIYTDDTNRSVANQFAAMPSLHFGWSLWCGLVVLLLAPKLWMKLLGLLHPLFTVCAIVATANHWVLDAVGGAVVVGAGFGLTYLLAGRRQLLVPANSVPAPRSHTDVGSREGDGKKVATQSA